MLASVGLSHMMMQTGRASRVCGAQVEVLFEPKPPPPPAAPEGQVWVFWPTGDRPMDWRAPIQVELGSTPGRLHRVTGSQTAPVNLPKLTRFGGFYLSRDLPGMIVLATDVNWAVSTSGYTPLLVPITP